MAQLKGRVAVVREAGDLVTDIPISALGAAPRDERVRVVCDGHATLGIFSRDHVHAPMTFVALEGESGFLELALVGDSAAQFLSIRNGAEVAVQW